MSQFKVGDRVLIIDSSFVQVDRSDNIVGTIVRIPGQNSPGYQIKVPRWNGAIQRFYLGEFESITK